MKKKNYVGKAVMLGALLAPIGLPTVSVLADGFYQNQTSAHRQITTFREKHVVEQRAVIRLANL